MKKLLLLLLLVYGFIWLSSADSWTLNFDATTANNADNVSSEQVFLVNWYNSSTINIRSLTLYTWTNCNNFHIYTNTWNWQVFWSSWSLSYSIWQSQVLSPNRLDIPVGIITIWLRWTGTSSSCAKTYYWTDDPYYSLISWFIQEFGGNLSSQFWTQTPAVAPLLVFNIRPLKSITFTWTRIFPSPPTNYSAITPSWTYAITSDIYINWIIDPPTYSWSNLVFNAHQIFRALFRTSP